jgi:hypothetical protein
VNIPQALADLLNKVDDGWTVFAHMIPTRIFRVVARNDFKAFQVQKFTRTNKDNLNPKGSWHSESPVWYDPTPGAMLQTACTAALKIQRDFILKNNKKMEDRVDAEIRRRGIKT